MNAGFAAIDRDLVAMRGLQRVESGTASQDRAGAFCAPASDWEYAEAMKRQTEAFDIDDLLDETDGHILYLLKAGFAEEAGRQLALRMKATVARRANAELA